MNSGFWARIWANKTDPIIAILLIMLALVLANLVISLLSAAAGAF